MYSKKIVVEADYEKIKECREEIKRISQAEGFYKEFKEFMEVSLGEALTNVIEHAQRSSERKEPIEILLTKNDKKIELEITFKGETISPEQLEDSKVLKEVEEIDELSESGRGIFIIHYLMDKVEYTKHGDYGKIRFVKNIGN